MNFVSLSFYRRFFLCSLRLPSTLQLIIAIVQVHAAKQRHRLPEDLFGLVQRIREVQVRNEIVGEETNGMYYCSFIE